MKLVVLRTGPGCCLDHVELVAEKVRRFQRLQAEMSDCLQRHSTRPSLMSFDKKRAREENLELRRTAGRMTQWLQRLM